MSDIVLYLRRLPLTVVKNVQWLTPPPNSQYKIKTQDFGKGWFCGVFETLARPINA